jgi:hypothetical protein
VQFLSDEDLSELCEAIDYRLSMSEKGSANVAIVIQQEKPKAARCSNSAHLYALEVIADKRSREQFTKYYDELVVQGFPSVTNPEYIRALTERLFKARLKEKELEYVVKLFSRVHEYITELVSCILESTTVKNNTEWNVLVNTAAKIRDRMTTEAIIDGCAKLKQGEKAVSQLGEMLDSREAQAYFRQISEKAIVQIRSQKPKSGIGKLFKSLLGDDGSQRGSKK